jgi:hypothetical protein
MGKRRVFIVKRLLDSQEWRISILGQYGFHGKTIAKIVSQPGHSVSVSTVYRVCKQSGFRLRDYRDGLGEPAERVLVQIKEKKFDVRIQKKERVK